MTMPYQLKELGKIARFEYGKSQTAVRSLDGTIPVYGTGGLMEYASSFLHPGPSVIVGRKGSLGNPFYTDGPFWAVDTTYYAAECGGNVRWLHYILCSLRLEHYNEATGVPSLARPTLNGLRVPLPSRDEQDGIVQILSTIDRAIEQTEALLAKQQRIKTGLMHDLLTLGLDAQGHLRDPSTHRFKPSAVGLIPAEWEEGTLATKAELHNNRRKPLSAAVRERMKGPFRYFGPTGVFDYINEYRLEGRYVLIGEDGDHFLKFATHEMTQLVDGRFNVNNHAHVLTGRNGCSTEWLHHFFRHRDLTYFLTRQGAGRFKLNKAAVLTLSLPIPPSDEQVRISERLAAEDHVILSSKAHLAKLRRLKTGLMHDLLTGRVPVTPLLAKPSSGNH